MKRYRLPRFKNLGKGYVVTIRCVPPEELAAILDEKNLPSPRRSAGGWDVGTRTIYIDKSLSLSEQWKVYFHELGHAVIDIIRMDMVGGRWSS